MKSIDQRPSWPVIDSAAPAAEQRIPAGSVTPGMTMQMVTGDADSWVRVTAVAECDGGPECPTVASRCMRLDVESVPATPTMAAVALGHVHIATADEVVVAPQPQASVGEIPAALQGPWRAVLRTKGPDSYSGPEIISGLPEPLHRDMDYEVAVIRGPDDAADESGLDVLYVLSDTCGDFHDDADLAVQWTRAQAAAAALNAYLTPAMHLATADDVFVAPAAEDSQIPASLRGPWRAIIREIRKDGAPATDVGSSRIDPAVDYDVVVLRGPDDAAGEAGISHSDVLFQHCTTFGDFASAEEIRDRHTQAQHVAEAVNTYIRGAVSDPGMWGESMPLPAWTVQVGCQVQAPTGTWLTVTAVDVGVDGSTTIHSSNGDIGHAASEQLLAVRYPLAPCQDRLARAYEEIGRLRADGRRLRRELADRAARLDAYLTGDVVGPPRVSLDEQPARRGDDSTLQDPRAACDGRLGPVTSTPRSRPASQKPTRAELLKLIEQLRTTSLAAAAILRPPAEAGVPDHPHAAIIAGLRELADRLEASPKIPGLRSLDVRGGTYCGSDEASVVAIHRAAEILGVEAETKVAKSGHRHWNVELDFGQGDAYSYPVEFSLSYVSDSMETPTSDDAEVGLRDGTLQLDTQAGDVR